MPEANTHDNLHEELRDIADRLHSIAIHLLRRLRKVDESTGLSGPRLSALSLVVFAGPVALTELAAAEQVKGPRRMGPTTSFRTASVS